MCGIAGFIPRRPLPAEQLRQYVRSMTGALFHRGPDDHGEFISAGVGLGMRRLSNSVRILTDLMTGWLSR